MTFQGRILHVIEEGENKIGSRNAQPLPNIVLGALSIKACKLLLGPGPVKMLFIKT